MAGEASVLPAATDSDQRAGEQEAVQMSLDLAQPQGREGARPLPQQVSCMAPGRFTTKPMSHRDKPKHRLITIINSSIIPDPQHCLEGLSI